MTNYGNQADYCVAGVRPSDDPIICNDPVLKYGDKLSVLDNDFSDLKVTSQKFASTWNDAAKTIEISNYSGQLGYIADSYSQDSADFVDPFFENSKFNFSLRLPVGDPQMSQCGQKEDNFSQYKCLKYPDALQPKPLDQFKGGSSLYGNINNSICGYYSPDLIVQFKDFDYHKNQAHQRCTGTSCDDKDVQAVVLTNICSYSGKDPGDGTTFEFTKCVLPKEQGSWYDKVGTNFRPGFCKKKNNQFECQIDEIL
jgi:hypothetical protein